jgi:hypothetical protein
MTPTADGVAWFGKGIAALAMSTGWSFTSREPIDCFERALSYSAGDPHDELKICISRWVSHFAKAISERYDQQQWLSSQNVKEIYALVVYADNLALFNADTMKYWVSWMKAQSYVDFSKAIAIYVDRIRRADPDYRQPRRPRDYAPMIIIAALAIVCGACLLYEFGYIMFVFLIGLLSGATGQ